jgi:competence protein ComEA
MVTMARIVAIACGVWRAFGRAKQPAEVDPFKKTVLDFLNMRRDRIRDDQLSMSTLIAWCISASAAFVLILSASVPRASAQEPSDDAGAQEFQAVCSKCHPPDRIVAARRTKTQWEETLEKMTKLGAPITDDNYDILLSYLVHHYGKVNVNRSTATDIAEAVGLTEQEAQEIVKYRDDHGPFADFDALAKVPGVDPAKLEKNKDAISF